MKKIVLLSVGFFLSLSLVPPAFAAGCSISLVAPKNSKAYSTTEGITMESVSGLSGDGQHRILVTNSSNTVLKNYCNSTSQLQNKVVLGNFEKGAYKVSITDRCSNTTIPSFIPFIGGSSIPDPTESELCSATFNTTSDAVSETGSLTLNVSPQSVKYGDSVTIVLDNIPRDSNTQGITIASNSQSRGGGSTLGNLSVVVSKSEGTCKIQYSSGLFTNASTPVCDDGGKSYRLTTVISTKDLQIDPSDTASHSFFVNLSTNTKVGSQFTVSAPQETKAFTIASVSPNPAKPGDTVLITLENTQANTQYSYGLSGTAAIQQKKTCTTTTCNIDFQLSRGITSNVVDVIVVDKDGNKQSTQLSITQTTPLVTQSPETPTPPPHVPLPCQVARDSAGGCPEVQTGLGISIPTDPQKLITYIFGFLLSISGGLALMLIIFSGYQIMTSDGNPEKIQAARDTITSAIIGLVFMIFSLVLLQIIGVQILHIPGFK